MPLRAVLREAAPVRSPIPAICAYSRRSRGRSGTLPIDRWSARACRPSGRRATRSGRCRRRGGTASPIPPLSSRPCVHADPIWPVGTVDPVMAILIQSPERRQVKPVAGVAPLATLAEGALGDQIGQVACRRGRGRPGDCSIVAAAESALETVRLCPEHCKKCFLLTPVQFPAKPLEELRLLYRKRYRGPILPTNLVLRLTLILGKEPWRRHRDDRFGFATWPRDRRHLGGGVRV